MGGEEKRKEENADGAKEERWRDESGLSEKCGDALDDK